MSVGNVFNIPHYLKAGSPERLRLKMLENNLILKAECQYFDIQFDGTEWVVWFYKEANEQRLMNKKAGK